MIDINLIRKDADMVRQNLMDKFQFDKLTKIDEVLALDEKNRNLKLEGDTLRAKKNILLGEVLTNKFDAKFCLVFYLKCHDN